MIVKMKTSTMELFESMYGRAYLSIEIDGEEIISFLDGEPEDANLGRDFGDCYRIPELMSLAFKAAERGETFEIIKEEVDDF